MTFDYEAYLLGALTRIVRESSFDEPVDVYISEEQNFAKMDELTPNTIYVVIKYLSSSIEYYAETTPIQLLVLSEQNSMEKAQIIMSKFTERYNWKVEEDGDAYVKQQYNSPVVLNNYVEVSYGWRSVLYVTGTLFKMDNVVDVKDVNIDSNNVKPLSFNISYSMSTNTQQLPNTQIATSMKTVSTFAITMMIPMRELQTTPGLITKIMKILDEQSTDYGNDTFVVKFKCGLYENGSLKEITKNMKLISAQIISAPNQIPTLQIGLMC